MASKKRIAVYVDGFNLYHALKNLKKNHLKWLNLRALAEKFISPREEVIETIFYFSAIATHIQNNAAIRHRAYIEALEAVGVQFVEGHFKKKDHTCNIKNRVNVTLHKHEEKETDVNIAIHMVRDAILRRFDKLILITNDTDINPAIRMAKAENSVLEMKLLTPPTYKTHDSLRQNIHPGKSSSITEGHIILSLLPASIKKQNGKIIHRPEEYTPQP